MIKYFLETEPVGSATRFSTAIKSFSHLNPLVLFSGDIFSPSMCKLNKLKFYCSDSVYFYHMKVLALFSVSTYTKGEHMVTVLNEIGTHCAVFGNHDFGE